MVSDRICSIEGCGRELRSKGFCALHYQKYRRSLIFIPVKPIIIRLCSIIDCGKKHSCKDLCRMHYNQTRKSRCDPNKPKRQPREKREITRTINVGKICDVDNCDNNAKCRGLCVRHYTRLRVHGNVHVNYHRKNKITKNKINKSELKFTHSHEEVMILNEFFDEMVGFNNYSE